MYVHENFERAREIHFFVARGKEKFSKFPPEVTYAVLQISVIFVNGTLIESWLYAVVRIHRSLPIKSVDKWTEKVHSSVDCNCTNTT